MATKREIFEAAKSAVRGEVRSHRPSQRIWTTIAPSAFGLDGDTWVIWAGAMVDRYNAAQVKPHITISETKRRGFLNKQLIEYAEALRDA